MIYFAHAVGTDLVKIGFTAGDPTKRLKELQTGCPQRLELLAAIDGTEADEGRWHKDFERDRAHGEWFKLTPRMMLAIARAEVAVSLRPALRAGGIDCSELDRAITDSGTDFTDAFHSRCRTFYFDLWELLQWVEVYARERTSQEAAIVREVELIIPNWFSRKQLGAITAPTMRLQLLWLSQELIPGWRHERVCFDFVVNGDSVHKEAIW